LKHLSNLFIGNQKRFILVMVSEIIFFCISLKLKKGFNPVDDYIKSVLYLV